MKHKNQTNKLRIFILALLMLFALGLIAGPAAAINITYSYKNPADETVIAAGTLEVSSTSNITLPNATLDLELQNNDSTFKVHVPSVAVGVNTTITVGARDINLSAENYTSTFGNTNSFTYYVLDGYAFRVYENLDKVFTVYFNYSNLSVVKPVIFKAEYNFTTNESNTSTNASPLTTYYDETTNMAYANVTSFSVFYLAEDHCNNGVQDYGEGCVDTEGACGGTCDTGGGGGGGSSGGGGGGGSNEQPVWVYPTKAGASVQVYKGDTLIVVYKGSQYTFEITYLKSNVVKLKDMSTYITYTFNLGDRIKIGLLSYTSQDIEVYLGLTDHTALFTFYLIDAPPPFSLPTLPARTAPQPTGAVTVPVTTPAEIPSNIFADQAEPVPTLPPRSPISIWTIIFASLFVIVLVGGFALYRAGIFHSDKPPTVTRTGLESSPEISMKASRPVHPPAEIAAAAAVTQMPAQPKAPFSQETVKQETVKQETVKQETVKQETVKQKPLKIAPVQKPIPVEPEVVLPRLKRLELERFVYHALAEGVSVPEIKKRLSKKNWPVSVVNTCVDEIITEHGTSSTVGLDEELKRDMRSIRSLLDRGVSEKDIRTALEKKGWNKRHVDRLFNMLNRG